MTEQEQRIAIAEFCGWKPENTISPLDGKTELTLWWNSPQKVICASGPPDYLHDLNAMHEAEEKLRQLDNGRHIDYADKLLVMLSSHQSASLAADLWIVIHATAAQRAEALLKTIGKWKD